MLPSKILATAYTYGKIRVGCFFFFKGGAVITLFITVLKRLPRVADNFRYINVLS